VAQPSQQAANTQESLPTLTSVEQVRGLSQAQANRGYPVRLRATVTYYTSTGPTSLPPETDPSTEPDMFIQDSTGGISVDVPPGGQTAAPGQLIEIEGITEQFDFGQEIGNPRWKVIGRAPLPAPHRASFDRMASTAEDGQEVEVEGVVRSAEQQTGFLILDVAVSGGRLRAAIPQFDQPGPERLVDAEVRIRGVCGAIFNQRNQLIGVLLFVPSLKEVQVTQPAPPDPFGSAAQPAFSVQRFSRQTPPGHRVHVQGVVSFSQPERLFFISSGPIGLQVETRQPTVLHAGDRVDVVGFPGLSDLRPVLEDATFRVAGRGTAPEPIPVRGKQLLEADYDSELVSIQARLLGKSFVLGSQTLVLQTDNLTLSASMEAPQPDPKLVSIVPGTLLTVTGVCLAKKDRYGNNQSFRLLFGQAEDADIIDQPSWWTLRHASEVVGCAALILLWALVWVVVLRRRVRRQADIIRQKYERELALEEQYRDLFENANDLIQSVDEQGKLLYVNRAWRETLGYQEEELAGLSIFDIIHPDSREQFRDLFRRLTSGEDIGRREAIFVTKGGRTVVLEGTSDCKFVDGKPVSTRSIFRDITERKRAEALLSLRTKALETAANGIVITDRNGQVVWVNAAFTALTGYSGEEVIGQHTRVLKSGRQDPKNYQDLWTTILAGKVWHGELINRCKDGSLYTEEMTITPVRDERGEVSHFIAIKQDVTERKRAQEALGASETRYRRLFEASRDGILLLDPDTGTITDANPFVLNMLGYTAEELLGKKLWDVGPFRDVAASQDAFQTLKKAGYVRYEDLPVEIKSGGRKDVEFTSNTYRSGGQEVIQCNIRDITERKRQEDMIRASLWEKEMLLKEIHHRVKNNLQVISSLLRLRAGAIRDEEALEMFRESQNRVRTMALIHEKLYRSKDLAHIDFGEYILSLVADLFHSYQINPEEVSFAASADHVPLGVDTAIPCGLIVNELVSNCLKHAFPSSPGSSAGVPPGPLPTDSPKTRGLIAIALTAGENKKVRLVVRDNGVGFPQSVDFRHTQSLGLQLVNALTDQLGGTIQVITNGGTEFQIEFTIQD